ncbi:MAG: DNA recombination protein RmuC, partial [Aeriscardovia sp.]|nr:DNA recombination protein RmuC [Aeriscardovia sp.]
MIALYIVIAGACCLVAGFLIGFFTKRPSGVNGMPPRQKEIEGLKADIEKEREALSSLRGEKEKAYLENATLSEKCRGYEEQIKGLKEEIESRQSEFDSRLAQQQQEVQKREEDLRSSIEKEFEKNRNLQKEAENRQNSNNEERVKAQAEILNALSPLTGQISSLQDALASAKENRASEVGELRASIEGLKDIEKSIQEENQNFSSLLNNNQLRGRWGEIQLENLVEKCGMSKHVDFDIQLSLSSKGKEGEERGRP